MVIGSGLNRLNYWHPLLFFMIKLHHFARNEQRRSPSKHGGKPRTMAQLCNGLIHGVDGVDGFGARLGQTEIKKLGLG